MSDQVKRWQGWTKTAGHPWRMVEGTLSEKRADCYTLLMEKVELQGHAELANELLILPEGEYPPIQATYQDRMMRPQR